MNLEMKKHYVNSTFSRWRRFWPLAPPPDMDPGSELTENSMGYLQLKNEWFLIIGSWDIHNQRNLNQNFDPN